MDLPPKVPETLAELDRAIQLLGQRSKHALKTKTELELADLIGWSPNQQQAQDWKKALKAFRDEEKALLKDVG